MLHHSRPKPPPKSIGKPTTVAASTWDWHEVLKQAGYPTDYIILDFETYFDESYSLRKDNWSTIEYVQSGLFEETGLGVYQSDLDKYQFYQGEDMVATVMRCWRETLGSDMPRFTVAAHNAVFDLSIMAFKHGLYPKYAIDLLGVARHWSSRSRNAVEHLAERFELETRKGDTGRFKGWTQRRRMAPRKKGEPPSQRPVFTDEKWAELKEYTLDDVRMEHELFKQMLPLVSIPKTEFRVMTHTLELFTKPSLMVDYERAEELVHQMENELSSVIGNLNKFRRDNGYAGTVERADISGNNSFEALLLEALQDAGDDPDQYKKPAKNKQGWKFAVAKDDAERELLMEHTDEHVRRIMDAFAAIKSWPNHIKRVNRIVDQSKAADGYLPVPLRYHGAHTGRWSGSEKINLQNLGSRGHALVNAIRELLIAPPGHELVIADASQIEARVLAWIAGQQDLVEKFANGEEIYCGFASKVLGRKIRKPVPEHLWAEQGCIPTIEKRMKWARNSVGKVGILGCLAERTPILTDRGWVEIEHVRNADRVWDGQDFVEHGGVCYQGDRKCVNVNHVWMTEDHEVYGKDGWFPAAARSTNSPLLAISSGTLRWNKLNLGHEVGLSVSNAAVHAVDRLHHIGIILSPENLHAVIRVLKLRLHGPVLTKWSAQNLTVADFLIAFVRLLDVATLDRTPVMADAESDATLRGSKTEHLFYTTCALLMGGTIPNWKSIGSTTTDITNRAIYGLSPDQRICKTYDIIQAGSNRRFQAGPLIVANCGYGMGAAKAEGYADGAIDFETAQQIVDVYRADNDKITQFWRDLEKAFMYVVKTGQAIEMPRGLKLYTHPKADVVIQLPNGRELKYHNVRIKEGKYGPAAQIYEPTEKKWQHTWGGSLTENVVQAISRDLLWEAVQAMEDTGYHVPLHVHDELISVVKEGMGETVLEAAIEFLSTRPDWAPDCPLAAEGHVTTRYGGH